jgi:hypothetical protein
MVVSCWSPRSERRSALSFCHVSPIVTTLESLPFTSSRALIQ